MAPQESEKKIMNDKVAKVRQVVDGVPTNDIIMVLHFCDLDVNKAIQAFCEDGAASILGEWKTSTGQSVTAAKKKKNKKNKSATEGAVAEDAPTTTTPAVTAAKPATVAATPAAPVPSRSTPTAVTKPPTSAKSTKPATEATDAVSEAFKKLQLALNEREIAVKKSGANVNLDLTAVLKAISSFGASNSAPKAANGPSKAAAAKTVSPPPAAGPIKHATSQSSINSSVGADSGVNLSPTHKATEEKTTSTKTIQPQKTTTVANGIQLSSAGLSAAQLAELTKTLQNSMAAHGVDASLLNSSDAVRRPKNNNNNKKGGQKNQKEQPKLSIL